MKLANLITVIIISILLTFLPGAYSIRIETEVDPLTESPRGDGPRVRIDDVDMDLRNVSGSFVLEFGADGMAGEGTDHINISMALYNGTQDLSGCLWIEPMNISFPGLRLSLIGSGEGGGAWTEWKMNLNISIPADMEPGMTLSLLMTMLGLSEQDLPSGFLNNLSLTGLLEMFDIDRPADIMDLGSIKLIARAYDAEGNWSQDEVDITLEVMMELIEFALSEGLLEDPSGAGGTQEEDEEESSSDRGEDGDNTLILAMLSGGSALFLLSIVSLALLYMKKNGSRIR